MRYKAREIRFGKEADKGGVFKKYPPPTTMLESYQRLGRIQTLQLREAGANNVACPSKKKLDTAQFLQRVELENQERLLRLTSISDPKRACCLTWSIGDYQDVEIEDNSVIYLDPPYLSGGKMTNEYVNGGENFDHERFYDWCLKQTQPLYISSYEMPESDFKVVAEFARIDTMSATNNGKLVSEKVFMPRTQETRGNIQLSLF